MRNMYQKVGMFGSTANAADGRQNQGPQVRGFGFLHDGSMDTLVEFLSDEVFEFSSPQARERVVDFIERLPPETVIHRVTAEAPRAFTLAPEWPFDDAASPLYNTAAEVFVDYDNDADLDLFVANGHIIDNIAEFMRMPDAHLGYLAYGWVTMGQLLSLPMMLVGAVMLIAAYRPEGLMSLLRTEAVRKVARSIGVGDFATDQLPFDQELAVDLRGGQKTGGYLDQRYNHVAAAKYLDQKT